MDGSLYMNNEDVNIDINDDFYIEHKDFPGIKIKLEGSHTAKEIHEFCATMTNIIRPDVIDYEQKTVRVGGK